MTDLLNNLSTLVSIPSVLDKPQKNAPFGKANRQALEFVLELARYMGFDTYNGDGYYGYIDWTAMCRIGSPAIIGILGHLDVVPDTEYKLTQKDGILYGRGVVDNKGPVLCVLEAMNKLKQSGYKPRSTIRLILGCNEESGSKCIERYRAEQAIPKASFVPDADFPVVISEMGILHLKVTLNIVGLKKSGITINGGERANVVPSYCEVTINNAQFSMLNAQLKGEFDFFQDDKLTKLTFHGKSAHAMCPHKGDNAIVKALNMLTKHSLLPTPYPLFPIQYKDESGEQTINLGIIKTNGDTIEMTFDLRCPATQDIEKLKDKIKTAFASAYPMVTLTQLHFAPPLKANPNSTLVRSLLDAYTSVTGLPAAHIKTGGGTYARALPNAVAFGPTFPDQITNIHEPNECISLDHLSKLVEIYKGAIVNLDKNRGEFL